MEISSNNEPGLYHVKLLPNTITPFWPTQYTQKQKNCIQVRPIAEKSEHKTELLFSQPFWYNSKHTTVLNLNTNVS